MLHYCYWYQSVRFSYRSLRWWPNHILRLHNATIRQMNRLTCQPRQKEGDRMILLLFFFWFFPTTLKLSTFWSEFDSQRLCFLCVELSRDAGKLDDEAQTNRRRSGLPTKWRERTKAIQKKKVKEFGFELPYCRAPQVSYARFLQAK